MTSIVLQKPTQCEKLVALKGEIDQISAIAKQQRVLDTATKDAALAIGAQVKRVRKALDDRRREITDPMSDTVKQIIAFAKMLDAPLAEAETHIRVQATEYAREIAEKQRIEEAKIMAEKIRLQKEADAKQRAAVAMAETFEEQREMQKAAEQVSYQQKRELAQKEAEVKAQGVKGTSEVWTYEITDSALVPRQFLVPDHTLIRNAVQRMGARDIPGMRIFSETKVSLRRY